MHKHAFWKRFLCLALCFILSAGMTPAVFAASEDSIDWSTLYTYGDPEAENTRITVQSIDGADTLVLPSTVSPTAVTLHLDIPGSAVVLAKGSADSVQLTDGCVLDLTALCGDGSYTVTFQAINGSETSEYQVNFLFSGNISTMYLVSDDPVNEGRAWVESSPDKSNKATGSMVLQNADGTIVYDDALSQIKGRGNSTWNGEKRPYQIKLDSKTDLLQTGVKANKSKTWVLLANYYDYALLRNTLALNLGNAMGMDTAVESTYVDLYYDGEYRGCYLLAEKVEVGGGRVDITDLEEGNEDANPDVDDLTDLPTATGTTENGAIYTYCEGMGSPDDITGGYLLEMDYADRAVEEICYFYTTRGTYVVVKSPECASKEEMAYIAALYQEYEDAVYNGGTNPATGKAYTDYVDLESTVSCYLINELSKNRDGFLSSAYLYKEAGEDTMTMGPLWDYDLSLGLGGGSFNAEVEPLGLYTAWNGFGAALYKLGDFREAVKAQYENTLYPLLKNVVLGDSDAVSADGALRSLSYYRTLIGNSAVCDRALWYTDRNWSADADKLNSFITQRTEYLKDVFASWSAETYEPLSEFSDVVESAWYYEEVKEAAKYGLMQGIGLGLFGPNDTAERSHVAKTIFNMAQASAVPYEAKFSDVPQGKWYTSAILWAANEGIVEGYPDGTFQPNAAISREHLVLLLYRYQGSPAVTTDNISQFEDADQISGYARDAMEWAVTEGVIQGYLGNTVQPQGTTNRAELAAILVRFYEKFILNAE